MSEQASSLKIEVQPMTGGFRLRLEGQIDERSLFAELGQKDLDKFVLDLNGVTQVNSYGVRLWMRWIWALEKDHPRAAIELENCPHSFIKQIMIVAQFAPKNTRIRSMILPFYCEECDELINVTYRDNDPRLKKTGEETDVSLYTEPCPKCRKLAEIDVEPTIYLKAFSKMSGN